MRYTARRSAERSPSHEADHESRAGSIPPLPRPPDRGAVRPGLRRAGRRGIAPGAGCPDSRGVLRGAHARDGLAAGPRTDGAPVRPAVGRPGAPRPPGRAP
ncbi:MAG: hypothetical protein F4Z74_12740 [Acidobacteria bacterium]|nr:hypothetical protein [Acidobacteriota bacterium]